MKKRGQSDYIHYILSLKRAYSLGGAPHKPILLLAIFSLIRKQLITSNLIYITPELVLEFREFWIRLVTTPHTPNFSLPFFHMRSEPFWKLKTKFDAVIPVTSSNSIKSLKALRESVSNAELDLEMFKWLQIEENNHIASRMIIDKYFNGVSYKTSEATNLFTDKIRDEVLNDTPEEYVKIINTLKEQQSEVIQEELFIRNGIFKREVPRVYNYHCAISGMRVESVSNTQMIDACHIIPFSKSHDDTIGNGICLTPTLHRAFDRGLISISENYEVLVSGKITESNSPFLLKQFLGKEILLPGTKYRPRKENLQWHNENIFIA